MRLLIASDLHGSLDSLRFLCDTARRLAPDMLVLLGDLVYHGPRNPLPGGYDTRAVLDELDRLNHLPCPVTATAASPWAWALRTSCPGLSVPSEACECVCKSMNCMLSSMIVIFFFSSKLRLYEKKASRSPLPQDRRCPAGHAFRQAFPAALA